MRLQLITEDELMSQLRRYRIESLADVKEARMESDGNITVTKKRKRKPKKQPDT
jgi:uncharacterized membrane protein YcaP (DUF421 family)